MINLRYLFFALWVGIILLLSLAPVPHVENVPENSDKVVHLLMYFLTSIVFYWVFHEKYHKVIMNALIFSIFFGAFIEGLQFFLPYRSFSLGDIFANSIGAVLGGVLLFFFCKYISPKSKKYVENVKS